MNEPAVDFEQVEALGISREAYDEILDIVGRIPTMEELSTLLAMWESNGRQQSLYGWLRGQKHTVERDEYLYTGCAEHRAIREPKVRECLAIAKELCDNSSPRALNLQLSTGLLLYMVGNVSTEFADGEYARRCLHIVDEPMGSAGREEDCRYIEMILGALRDAGQCGESMMIGQGGLFCSLMHYTMPLGYDILSPREVRLDAFLFGEECGRYIVSLSEEEEDQFLLKLDEARLNCCFLGRTTKNRVVVNGFDFGPVGSYMH
ncbi:MAG: hypothetical protein IKC19_05415 [Bacteroidales bacterium]|nr:hypothetical protein [Bacteroidales bacterium]